MRIRNFFPRIRIRLSADEKKFRIRLRIRPEIVMKKKIYLYFSKVGIKFDIITHHFMLEFVDSDLDFVQDKNNLINPLLQVGSSSVEKKYRIRIRLAKNHRIRRIRILIPGLDTS